MYNYLIYYRTVICILLQSGSKTKSVSIRPYFKVTDFLSVLKSSRTRIWICLLINENTVLNPVPIKKVQCCGSGSFCGKLDLDPHQSGKPEPDPHQSEKVEALEVILEHWRVQIWEKVSGKIQIPGFRIRIHFLRIRIRRIRMEANTDPDTDPDPDPIRIQGFNAQK